MAEELCPNIFVRYRMEGGDKKIPRGVLIGNFIIPSKRKSTIKFRATDKFYFDYFDGVDVLRTNSIAINTGK